MEDCRLMATLLVKNMNKVVNSYSKLLDARICRKLIGCLMYFFNTSLDIFFVVNTLS
jgi:hypothetical protein